MSVSRTYTTYLSLEHGVEEKVIKLLVPLLADASFICSLYKKYQWHVEGDDYFQYSPLFEKLGTEELAIVEQLVRRIRILGADAPVLPAEITAHKTLDEPADPHHDDESMIRNMCTMHEGFIKLLRQTIEKVDKLHDPGTQHLLIDSVLELQERQLLVVRSSLDQ